MATTKRIVLVCDECGAESTPGENAKDARNAAASDGWLVNVKGYPPGPRIDWCDMCKLSKRL